MSVAKDIETKVTEFRQEMTAHWKELLSSIVLYGSAVRDDYVPGRSDLNFLVLASELPPQKLVALQPRAKKWAKARIATPVFMRSDNVPLALDSYPLEFLSMKNAYHVVHGTDPLAQLSFATEAVRLQCERELRGNLLHLRAGLVDCGGKRDRMHELIRASLPAFTAVFQGLLFVAGRPHGLWDHDLIEGAGSALGIDASLFHGLARVRTDKKAPSKEELGDLLVRYVDAIEHLTAWADRGGTVTASLADQ